MASDDIESRRGDKNNHSSTSNADAFEEGESQWASSLIPLLANVAMFLVVMYSNNCPRDLKNRGSSFRGHNDKCAARFLGRFSFQPLRETPLLGHSSATNFLGEDGFGPVHKGFIDDKLRPGLKAQPVAVKLLDLDGAQGHREWLTEVIFLGQLRHAHLVKLIGYCCEEEHRLLVYEYMPRGSLENQLFRRFSVPFPWSARLKISLGVAKGLAFLHEAKKPIIYRDFKASNILLDSDYTSKLSDFGLTTEGPEGDNSHVSTRVMGTQDSKPRISPTRLLSGNLQ